MENHEIPPPERRKPMSWWEIVGVFVTLAYIYFLLWDAWALRHGY